VDSDVARLAQGERLVAAAELAASRGDLRTASELFERACEWARAARAALAAGDHARALPLAALASDDETAATALQGLASTDQPTLLSLGAELTRHARHGWAARTYEVAGAALLAANAWERAGDSLAAARILEELHDVTRASRVLETALRRDPERGDLHVALGGLLLRHGKPEAALRVLQRVADDDAHKRAALSLCLPALRQLGLIDALAEATHLLTSMGGATTSDPETRSAAPPRARLYGRYEVVREVASTATSRVVECIDVVRGERVAVKVFSAVGAGPSGRDALARFVREARVLGQLSHPNIVPLRDVLPHGPAIVLAWMPGGTLEARLTAGPLSPVGAAEIARSVLQALGEAHRLGVLHRDVKPANVLFDEAGGTRLSDFGVAHLGDLSVTATAGVFGSLAYMSPEQREGRPATTASDLFGVGAILYEMLTGRRPNDDATARPRPTGFHRYLDARHDALVDAMLATDPSVRPTDAFSAAAAIGALAWPAEVGARSDDAPRARPPASVRPAPTRLDPGLVGEVARDTWLDRPVATIALGETTLERASAFARAGDRALQAVLRIDPSARAVWLGVPTGTVLDRPLEAGERERLARALARLHAAGVVHGNVRRDQIVMGEDGPVLLFSPAPDGAASAALDRASLAELAR